MLRLAEYHLQRAVIDHHGLAVDGLVHADSGRQPIVTVGRHVGRDGAEGTIADQGLAFAPAGGEAGEEQQEDQEQIEFHGFLLFDDGVLIQGVHDFFSFLPGRNDRAGYWERTN